MMRIHRILPAGLLAATLIAVTAAPASADIKVSKDNSGPYCMITYTGKEKAATIPGLYDRKGSIDSMMEPMIGKVVDKMTSTRAKKVLEKEAHAKFLASMSKHPSDPDELNDAMKEVGVTKDDVKEATKEVYEDFVKHAIQKKKVDKALDNATSSDRQEVANALELYYIAKENNESGLVSLDSGMVDHVVLTTRSLGKYNTPSGYPDFIFSTKSSVIEDKIKDIPDESGFTSTNHSRLSPLDKSESEFDDVEEEIDKDISSHSSNFSDGYVNDDFVDAVKKMFHDDLIAPIRSAAKDLKNLSADDFKDMNIANAKAILECVEYLKKKDDDGEETKYGPIDTGSGFLGGLFKVIGWILLLGLIGALLIAYQMGAFRRFGLKPIKLTGKAAELKDQVAEKIPDDVKNTVNSSIHTVGEKATHVSGKVSDAVPEDLKNRVSTGFSEFTDKASQTASKAAHAATAAASKAAHSASDALDNVKEKLNSDEQAPTGETPNTPETKSTGSDPADAKGFAAGAAVAGAAAAGTATAGAADHGRHAQDTTSTTGSVDPTPSSTASHATSSPASVPQAPGTYLASDGKYYPIPDGYKLDVSGQLVKATYTDNNGNTVAVPDGYRPTADGKLVPTMYLASDGKRYPIPAGFILNDQGQLIADNNQ